MKKEEKALSLCKEYDRLLLAIKHNTKEIGEGAELCSRWVDSGGSRHIPGGVTHLTEAFEPYESDGEYFPTKQWNDEPAILEIIGDCAGCLKAYNAVQARKANKKALGVIKRSIRMIGRSK